MNHINACSKLHELKDYQKKTDQKLINQFSVNLRNTLDALNLGKNFEEEPI